MSVGFPEKQNFLHSLDEISLKQYKKDFAYALLKNPTDVFKAAREVFPLDPTTALKIHDIWPFDQDVILYKKEIQEQSEEEHFLPGKTDFLKKVWDRLTSTKEDSDFVKLADLYAKARDFYPETKKEASVNIIGDCAKVMLVTSSGSDEEWERKVAQQQQQLLSDAD